MLTNISIKVWNIYPYKYGLLDCAAKVLPLPAHFLSKLSRIVRCLVVDWWSCMCENTLGCSLNLSPKVLSDFPMYTSLQSNS